MGKTRIHISISQIAEAVAEDESGELMAEFLACLMREFKGAKGQFGEWLQAATNDAIWKEEGDEWSDEFLSKLEALSLDLFPTI